MSVNGIVMACSSCGARNRIKLERMGEKPKCGRCGTAVPFPTEPIELSDESFEELVARSSLPVLVDFWAPWCGPCKTFAPTFARVARETSGRVLSAKLNVDQAPKTSARLAIQSIPTVALYRGGRELIRQVGTVSYDELLRMCAA